MEKERVKGAIDFLTWDTILYYSTTTMARLEQLKTDLSSALSLIRHSFPNHSRLDTALGCVYKGNGEVLRSAQVGGTHNHETALLIVGVTSELAACSLAPIPYRVYAR